jgi:phosphoribosylamine--glycine ligase
LAEQVFVAPGNAGTATEVGVENVAIKATDVEGLIRFAQEEQIGLTIIGPEAALAEGVVDAFEAAGLPCFGPTRRAAQLEASKSFAKTFLARYDIPTAAYRTFTDYGQALDYVKNQPLPIVIKADGLAAGKGVVIAEDLQTAETALQNMLVDEQFGTSGHRVVIEDFLVGEEASFICLVDGEKVIALASSQDHKARDEGDAGPNTGGMGAYSPAPIVTDALHERIMSEIIHPTLRGLAQEGTPYRGFLYAGLMISPEGAPSVVEFNCRLGDPETQPILIRLQSDLVAACLAALDGSLEDLTLSWDSRTAIGVVMAAEGYPVQVRTGDTIEGLTAPKRDDLHVFHAGTTLCDGAITTSGGRVLCVTALGDTLQQARQIAYNQVSSISWPGCFYRKDIGHRALTKTPELA